MMRFVEEIMTPAPFTANRNELVGPIRDAMLRSGVHCIPVVDVADHAVGIVSSFDLVEEYSPQESIENVMTEQVITIGAHQSASEAAAIMRSNFIHHLIVVNETAETIGILSSLDLLGELLED
jgi:CBS domain-containing protein